MQDSIKQPLTNVQLELLKIFSHQVSDKELYEIKKILVDFFAQKAISLADNVWDKEKWDDSKVEELLQTKLRKK